MPTTPKKNTTTKKAAPKKPAAKKAPAKRASRKEAEISIEDPGSLPPIVHRPRFGKSEEDKQKVLSKMTLNVRKSIDLLSERSEKRPVRLLTPAMLRRALTPYEELYYQYMLNSIGFRTPVAIEIVAQEKIGATTFVMDWMSRLLDMGCYVIYCECEGKQMDDKRIKRLMDTDPRTATLKMNAIEWAEARSLAEFDNTLRKTVTDLRKRCDANPETKGNPIFFIGDPWGALMSTAEAKGNYDWGLAANAKKEAPKDTVEGSNFGHAKHAQGMARWLPAFMEANNCSVIFVNKQNDKIEMGPSRPGQVAPSPMKNDTRVGGRALKRLCAYRMTMLKMGDLRQKGGDKKVYGHDVRMMMVANSYGPRDRTCEATIMFDFHEDTDDYQAPGFTYDERTAAWLVAGKFLGVKVDNGLYTCDLVGCAAVSARELMAELRKHPEHQEYVGSQMGIEGYARPVVEIVAAAPFPEDEEDSEDFDALVPADEEGGEENE